MPPSPGSYGQSGFPTAQMPNGQRILLQTDAEGRLLVAPQETAAGATPVYDIAAATVVKNTPGQLLGISVITAGTTTGTANDSATEAGVAIGNQFFTIPDVAGFYPVNWPCAAGIVIVPGTGQVVACVYE